MYRQQAVALTSVDTGLTIDKNYNLSKGMIVMLRPHIFILSMFLLLIFLDSPANMSFLINMKGGSIVIKHKEYEVSLARIQI